MRERLVAILGRRGAAKLMRALGDHVIRVPRSPVQERVRRDAQLVKALRHMGYREVARRFGVSPSTVVRAAKRAHDL